jgi:hypothetical protein
MGWATFRNTLGDFLSQTHLVALLKMVSPFLFQLRQDNLNR